MREWLLPPPVAASGHRAAEALNQADSSSGGNEWRTPLPPPLTAPLHLPPLPLGGCLDAWLGLSLRWDLTAGEMSRMAHGGFGLEVDPIGMEESEQALSSGEVDQADEVDWTQVWRLDQFIALGFDDVRASLMADDARVDLAQARKLIALGCPLETASRILL